MVVADRLAPELDLAEVLDALDRRPAQEPMSPGTVLDDAPLAVEGPDASSGTAGRAAAPGRGRARTRRRTRPASGRARAGARARDRPGSRPDRGRCRARRDRRRRRPQQRRSAGGTASWRAPRSSGGPRGRLPIPTSVGSPASDERLPRRTASASDEREGALDRDRQDERRDDAGQEPAERTAGGDRQVVLGQPFGYRAGRAPAGRGRRAPAHPSEPSATANVSHSGIDAPANRVSTRPSASGGSSRSADAQPDRPRTRERQHERQQVDRQWPDPQERDRRDVDRQLGGRPDHETGRDGRQPDPCRGARGRVVADRRPAAVRPTRRPPASTTAPTTIAATNTT